MEHLVNALGHIAWPVTVLVIGYFAQDEIRRIFGALARRIEEKNTDVSIGKEGLHISTAIQTTEAKLEAHEVDIEQVRSLIMESLHPTGPERSQAPDGAIDAELRTLADDYLKIDIDDWSQRLRAKEAAARGLGNYVITHKISKDRLCDETQEGLILALAAAIHAMPEAGDTERLLRICHGVGRLHVKYRIVLALSRLIERGIVAPTQVPAIRQALHRYEYDADTALKKRIQSTLTLLDRLAQTRAAG